MIHAFGIGLAIATTASLALAHNNDEDKKGEKALPTNVLADAKITFKPGAGITVDGGKEFGLTLKHQFQVGWRFVNQEKAADTNGFYARRIRQSWAGHVFKEDIKYKLNWEFASVVSVKDAYMTYKFLKSGDNSVTFWVGQGKFRSSLQHMTSSTQLELTERSAVTRTFSDARSTGGQFHGQHLADGKLGWHVDILQTDVAAASANAAEESTNTGSNKLNYNIGVNFDPFGHCNWSEGDLEHTGNNDGTFGANIYIGSNGAALTTTNKDVNQVNLFGAWKNGSGISAQAEIFSRTEELSSGGTDSESTGWYVQGGCTTKPGNGSQYGFVGRLGMIDQDDANQVLMGGPAGIPGAGTARLGAAKGDVMEANVGVSQYYRKHSLKTQLMYTLYDTSVNGNSAADTTDHGLSLMFSAIF